MKTFDGLGSRFMILIELLQMLFELQCKFFELQWTFLFCKFGCFLWFTNCIVLFYETLIVYTYIFWRFLLCYGLHIRNYEYGYEDLHRRQILFYFWLLNPFLLSCSCISLGIGKLFGCKKTDFLMNWHLFPMFFDIHQCLPHAYFIL